MEGPKERDGGGGTRRREARRSWTRRVAPFQYERYTEVGNDGISHIYFRFEMPPGQVRLDDAIYGIFQAHKRNPRTDYPAGLKAVRGRGIVAGTLWSLPDNQIGRSVADSIDMTLGGLADEMMDRAVPDRSI